MNVEHFTNEFGGPSLRIRPGADLSLVATPFTQYFTEEYRAALASRPDYFGQLAMACRIPGMKEWLQRLAQVRQCEVEINISEWATAALVKVDRFQLSLRGPVDLPDPGRSLEELYSLVLGTWHMGFPNAGGLHEPRTVAEYGLLIDSDVTIPNDAVAFFTTLNGDSVIAANGVAYWYSHDTRGVIDVGPVHSTLSTYFELLLKGKEQDFAFPY